MKKILLVVLVLIVSACSSILPLPEATPTPTAAPPYRIAPEENPFETKLEDVGWQIASVTITSVDLSERYDFSPPRASLGLVGYMPSVCNELRVEISPPDEEYNVFIEVYSLVNPDVQCDNVFQQFETSILLGTYSPGRYYVWINGALMGDFVSY